MKFWLKLGLVFLVIFAACSKDAHQSKYAGQEKREIKSLSPDDIQELKNGGGWGLAKAAELNGVPGPAHILEMGDKIGLSEEQRSKVQTIFLDMRASARTLGKQLISLELDLNKQFSNRTIDQTQLEKLVREIEGVRAKLRIVHLSTHLKTPDILTDGQIARYNELRGYSKDPCKNIPEGHNPEMWKKHNGCG